MTSHAAAADLALLTGPEAPDLLGAAVESAGGRLLDWAAEEVDHRPGHSTTVAYAATVAGPDGERRVRLGASTGLGPVDRLPPGVLALSDGRRDVAVWVFPTDPWLPALAGAMDEETVGALVTSLGGRGDDVRLRLVRYRPGRRAVVEVRAGDVGLFLKVVRPGEAEPMHERHVLLTEAGLPTPTSHGWHADGLVVLGALRGTPMRRALRERSSYLPDGEALLDLARALPPAARSLPRGLAWSDDVDHYARVVGAALPAEAAHVADVAGRVAAGLTGQREWPDVVHGDLYEGQLLLDGGRVSGLLDVDTLGPGRRADDLACLLGHLVVQVQAEPGHEAATLRLAHQWLEVYERAVDPVELRLRTAGVILSLAPGPHRVQEPDWERATRDRVVAAESWVRSAERLAGGAG